MSQRLRPSVKLRMHVVYVPMCYLVTISRVFQRNEFYWVSNYRFGVTQPQSQLPLVKCQP